MYFFLYKSLIWRTLGYDMKEINHWHFHNALKEQFWPKKILNFMHRLKRAILAIFHFCQNGTFEPLHEIQNFFWPKLFFWSIMKMAIRNFFHIMALGPPNPGCKQEKVQKGYFLKKDSRELKHFSYFRFLWISRRPGTLNWEQVVSLPSKNLYRKCEPYRLWKQEVVTFCDL